MKHPLRPTLLLVVFFLLAQLIGMGVLFAYVDVEETQRTGEVIYREAAIGPVVLERPEIDSSFSFMPIIIAVAIGTLFLLLLIRWSIAWIWKTWFVFAIFFALSISFSAFLPAILSIFLAALLAIWRILSPNLYVHTVSELFLYSGIAVLFVPMLNLFSVIILLICISLYDVYAVWKSKHMISLARFQTKSGAFAGFLFPYKGRKFMRPQKEKEVRKKKYARYAILGGGDVAFPLLFAGVLLTIYGFVAALTSIIFAAVALLLLLIKGKPKKFYPAMPFLSIGCFTGLALYYLVNLII